MEIITKDIHKSTKLIQKPNPNKLLRYGSLPNQLLSISWNPLFPTLHRVFILVSHRAFVHVFLSGSLSLY